MNEVYSVSKAARFLGVSPVTLRKWDNNGELRCDFRTAGGRRYLKQTLESKIEELKSKYPENKKEVKPCVK